MAKKVTVKKELITAAVNFPNGETVNHTEYEDSGDSATLLISNAKKKVLYYGRCKATKTLIRRICSLIESVKASTGGVPVALQPHLHDTLVSDWAFEIFKEPMVCRPHIRQHMPDYEIVNNQIIKKPVIVSSHLYILKHVETGAQYYFSSNLTPEQQLNRQPAKNWANRLWQIQNNMLMKNDTISRAALEAVDVIAEDLSFFVQNPSKFTLTASDKCDDLTDVNKRNLAIRRLNKAGFDAWLLAM